MPARGGRTEGHVSGCTFPMSMATYAQVGLLRAVAGNLLRPQRRGCKGAHGGSRAARRAHGLAQWPSYGLAQGHCVKCDVGGAACSKGGGCSGQCRRRPRSFLPAQAGRRCRFWGPSQLGQPRDARRVERAFHICVCRQARALTPPSPSVAASFPVSLTRIAFHRLSLATASPASPDLPCPQSLPYPK